MAEIKIEDLYSKGGVPLQNQVQRNANDIASLKLDIRNTAGTPVLSTAWVQLRTSMWNGYVAADGQLLKRADYPDAWEAIEAGKVPVTSDAAWLAAASSRGCFTTGDGSTTFRVPDYNGKIADSLGAVFMRGDGKNSHANGAGYIQGDALQDHDHKLPGGSYGGGYNFNSPSYPAIGSNFGGYVQDYSTKAARGVVYGTAPAVSDSSNHLAAARTASETRPVAATGCWAIKLFGAVQNAGEIDAATLATQLAEAQSKIAVLEQRKSTCLVNATGTGAPHETVVSQLPANISVNTRYVIPNPFGNSTPVQCIAEVKQGGKWFATGWLFTGTNQAYGVAAGYVQGEGVIVQTARNFLCSYGEDGGGVGGQQAAATSLPCRVFVRKLEA